MQLVRTHHVRIESNFTNLVMGIVVLEGLGRQLDPNLDIFQTALPILRHAHSDYREQARTYVPRLLMSFSKDDAEEAGLCLVLTDIASACATSSKSVRVYDGFGASYGARTSARGRSSCSDEGQGRASSFLNFTARHSCTYTSNENAKLLMASAKTRWRPFFFVRASALSAPTAKTAARGALHLACAR